MSARGNSPKVRAHLARMRAIREARRNARVAAGGRWQDGHWLTAESYAHGEAMDPGEAERRKEDGTIHPLDFNDRSSVDWSDVDRSGVYE